MSPKSAQTKSHVFSCRTYQYLLFPQSYKCFSFKNIVEKRENGSKNSKKIHMNSLTNSKTFLFYNIKVSRFAVKKSEKIQKKGNFEEKLF